MRQTTKLLALILYRGLNLPFWPGVASAERSREPGLPIGETRRLKFELEGREVVVRAGEVLTIPSNVPHRAVALEDTLDLDIFSPIRLDWLKKDDEYLRRGEMERVKS